MNAASGRDRQDKNGWAATAALWLCALGAHVADAGASWSFVYGFFSNGTPFDAPNRSEPCFPAL